MSVGLWKVEITGKWRRENDIYPAPGIGDWALTWWVEHNVPGFNVFYANILLDRLEFYYGVGSPESWWGPSFWLDETKAIYVDTGEFHDRSPGDRLGSANETFRALPFQVAIMAWGNSKDLRRQVRHWFCGWNTLILEPDGTVNPTRNANLDGWCKQWFLPWTTVLNSTMTPVVYDAAADVTREIISYHRMSFWRTIRRRAVDQGEVRNL